MSFTIYHTFRLHISWIKKYFNYRININSKFIYYFASIFAFGLIFNLFPLFLDSFGPTGWNMFEAQESEPVY